MITLIFGAGGHALEVTAVGLRSGVLSRHDTRTRYVVAETTSEVRGDLPYPVITEPEVDAFVDGAQARVIVAIGLGSVRAAVVDRLGSAPWSATFPNVIDPSAVLFDEVHPDRGFVAFPHTVLSTRVRLGSHVHLNSSSEAGHECELEDFVTVSPQAVVCGRASIGRCTFVGAGAVVIEDAHAPHDSMIGAGAVVLPGLTEPGTYSGAPARRH